MTISTDAAHPNSGTEQKSNTQPDLSLINRTLDDVDPPSGPSRMDGPLPREWGRAKRVRYATETYMKELEDLDDDVLPAELDANSELIERTTRACIVDWVGSEDKRRPIFAPGGVPASLTAWQTATLASRWHRIRRVAHAGLAERSRDELRVFETSGPDKGLWIADESALRARILRFDQDINDQKMKEILGKLYDSAARIEKTTDRDLVPCKSRVFDFHTKTQRDYDPDVDVFTSKLAVDCPLTTPDEPVRFLSNGASWRFSDWLLDLFEPLPDATEVAETVWEIISAVVRPGVRWNKAALFHSTLGESGKGTIVEMIQSLFGEGSSAYCSIPLDQWGGSHNDFKLEPLLTAMAVLVDENPVGEYLAFMASFKAAVTGDRMSINRKNKPVLTIRFRGFIIQCVNALLSTKDKSGSFARRQLFVPFPKSFTNAVFPEIKDVFLNDPAVLEYILWRALHMEHYTLSEPASCRELKEEARMRNDLVREWFSEVRERFTWDLLPFSFLHCLFEAWRVRESPDSKRLTKQTFIDRLLEAVHNDELWACDKRDKVTRAEHRMLGEEPMLREFQVPVDAWNRAAITYKGLTRQEELPLGLRELEELQQRDIAAWTHRASTVDGVETTHAETHAAVRRSGYVCDCMNPAAPRRPELHITAVLKRSLEIDRAVSKARIGAGVSSLMPAA